MSSSLASKSRRASGPASALESVAISGSSVGRLPETQTIVSSSLTRRLQQIGLVLAVASVVASPRWGPPLLSRLDFFHARRIEFEGVHYSRASELLALLAVDTLQSVWQPLEPLSVRVETHDLVSSADVTRRLPSTLVVRVVEREPVALVQADGRLQPVDGTARLLPIDPIEVSLDVPLVGSADSALLGILDGLRRSEPRLYSRIAWAARVGKEELRFELGGITVRTNADVTVTRFRDILPVEADLARNAINVVELDLRFRDQVIVRQP